MQLEVSTGDPITSARALISLKADSGQGLILRAITKTQRYNMFITYNSNLRAVNGLKWQEMYIISLPYDKTSVTSISVDMKCY